MIGVVVVVAIIIVMILIITMIITIIIITVNIIVIIIISVIIKMIIKVIIIITMMIIYNIILLMMMKIVMFYTMSLIAPRTAVFRLFRLSLNVPSEYFACWTHLGASQESLQQVCAQGTRPNSAPNNKRIFFFFFHVCGQTTLIWTQAERQKEKQCIVFTYMHMETRAHI